MRGAYWLGLLAGVVIFADAAFYLMVIRSQDGPGEWGRVGFVTALIVLAGVLTLEGSVAHGRTRAVMLGAATPILLVLGILGALSIGPPLFLAGIVTAIGALLAMRERRPSRPPARRPRSASSRP
jgi:hypothetical protein